MKPMEIYLKSKDEDVMVHDIQVSGHGADAYVTSVDAIYKHRDEWIDDEELIEEICVIIDDEFPEVVQEIAFENAVGAAESQMDAYFDR